MRFPDGIQRLGVLLLGASGLALAQTAQTPPPVSPPPRAMIRRGPLPHTAPPQPQGPLLAFEIAAFDARGAPIPQLALGDLRIYDDGRRMRPAFIRPVESAAPSAPLGPDEYSNRPIRGASRATLVLLDRPVAPGVCKVRIVVRDSHSGNVGSLTIPLSPPSP